MKFKDGKFASLLFQRLHSCLLANLANFVTFVKFAMFATCKRALLSCHLHWLVGCWRRWRICLICQIYLIREIYHIRQTCHIGHSRRGPSRLVICIDLLVAGEVGKIVKIASKAMQSLVGNFDNFANFVVTGISGHKWIRVKRLAKRTLERRASFLTLRTVPF